MSEEKKPLENNSGEIQKQNQGNQPANPQGGESEDEELKRLQEKLKAAEEEARIAREDAAKYQSEADRAKAKLSAEEQLSIREEGLIEREHNVYLSEIQRDYPEVFKSYPEAFDALKGSDKSEYINQAKYLQQGIDKYKQSNLNPSSGGNPSSEGNKVVDAGNAGDKNLSVNDDGAPVIPASNQSANSPHIFTRKELAEHKGDLEWYRANEAEINRQLEKGLIK